MEALSPSVKLVIAGSPFIIALDIAVVVGVPLFAGVSLFSHRLVVITTRIGGHLAVIITLSRSRLHRLTLLQADQQAHLQRRRVLVLPEGGLVLDDGTDEDDRFGEVLRWRPDGRHLALVLVAPVCPGVLEGGAM